MVCEIVEECRRLCNLEKEFIPVRFEMELAMDESGKEGGCC